MFLLKFISGILLVMAIAAFSQVYALSDDEYYEDKGWENNSSEHHEDTLDEITGLQTNLQIGVVDMGLITKQIEEVAAARKFKLTNSEVQSIISHVQRIKIANSADLKNKNISRGKVIISAEDANYIGIIINAAVLDRNLLKTVQRLNIDYERLNNACNVVEGKRSLKAIEHFEIGLYNYLLKQDYYSILENYNKAIEYNSGYTAAYMYRGLLYHEKGQLDLALADYGKVMELDRSLIEVYQYRGRLFLRSGQYDAAIMDFNKLIDAYPSNTEAHYNRGYCYKMAGKYAQSLVDYQRLIELSPQSTEVYYARAGVYESSSQLDLAMADYKKILEINPRAYKALNNRGLIMMRRGQFEQALLEFAKAIEVNPENPEGYYNKGSAAAALGHNREAVGLWRSYLAYAQPGDYRIEKTKKRIKQFGFDHKRRGRRG